MSTFGSFTTVRLGIYSAQKGLDVKGKVVLIDINQAEDWWISVPAYEAYTRGALCVLACNVDGYAYYDQEIIAEIAKRTFARNTPRPFP